MKIAIIGNLAWTANEIVIGLRRAGIEADLFVGSEEYKLTFSDLHGQTELNPEWVHCLNASNIDKTNKLFVIAQKLNLRGFRSLGSIFQLLKYDVIHAHTGALNFSIIAWLLFVRIRIRPYLAFATGSDLTEVVQFGVGFHAKMMRDFFHRANKTFLLNGNMVGLRKSLRLENAEFFPFAINEKKYTPANDTSNFSYHQGKLICYMMSNLDFGISDNKLNRNSMKCNDRFFYALDKFRKIDDKIHAYVTYRGPDKENARNLVTSLQLEDYVTFLQPGTELERIELIRKSDVILDQFYTGGFGIGALQVLSIGKPLITYYREECISESYNDKLPILNAHSSKDIFNRLIELRDSNLRIEIGKYSREWILKHHSRDKVISLLISNYNTVITQTT